MFNLFLIYVCILFYSIWDLNSNLDVFGMQTFLRGLNYVRWAIQAAHVSL